MLAPKGTELRPTVRDGIGEEDPECSYIRGATFALVILQDDFPTESRTKVLS